MQKGKVMHKGKLLRSGIQSDLQDMIDAQAGYHSRRFQRVILLVAPFRDIVPRYTAAEYGNGLLCGREYPGGWEGAFR
jgi:hypothetical protein